MAGLPSSKVNILNLLNYKDEDVGGPVIEAEIFKKMTKVFNEAQKAVCKVKSNVDQGTGAFYDIVDHNDGHRFLFMTCNHVLPTNSFDEASQATLEFEEIENMKSIKLDTKHIQYIWTRKLFDATIIEISEELAKLFQSYGAIFLKVGPVTAKTGFAMLQYPCGKFGIAHGEIDTVSGCDVFYQIGTAPGSSGSPLLDWNCIALAMHRSGEEGSTGKKPELWRKAMALNATIEAYLKEKANDPFECV